MKAFVAALFLFSVLGMPSEAEAAGKAKRHCEVKKKGKHVDLSTDEVPDRKACKARGGKWVKDHGHGHDHGEGSDHDHDEE